METKLKPYMGCYRDEPQEGAILIFAHTAKEAKKVGWSEPSWIRDSIDSFLDFRVTLIKNNPDILKDGNHEKLSNNIPHVNDSPTSCKGCGLWGKVLNEKGLCDICTDDEDDCEHEWFFPSTQSGTSIRRCAQCGKEQQKINEFWQDLN